MDMIVRLNITLDARLYRRLKARAPSRKISAFIAEAIEARLAPSPAELETAYKAAAREAWRGSLSREWSSTETEAWPD